MSNLPNADLAAIKCSGLHRKPINNAITHNLWAAAGDLTTRTRDMPCWIISRRSYWQGRHQTRAPCLGCGPTRLTRWTRFSDRHDQSHKGVFAFCIPVMLSQRVQVLSFVWQFRSSVMGVNGFQEYYAEFRYVLACWNSSFARTSLPSYFSVDSMKKVKSSCTGIFKHKHLLQNYQQGNDKER